MKNRREGEGEGRGRGKEIGRVEKLRIWWGETRIGGLLSIYAWFIKNYWK